MASFLMTEARQHNTEIRMAVSKVADKMDHLMTKVSVRLGTMLKMDTSRGTHREQPGL